MSISALYRDASSTSWIPKDSGARISPPNQARKLLPFPDSLDQLITCPSPGISTCRVPERCFACLNGANVGSMRHKAIAHSPNAREHRVTNRFGHKATLFARQQDR
jgi:hypothetical protein